MLSGGGKSRLSSKIELIAGAYRNVFRNFAKI